MTDNAPEAVQMCATCLLRHGGLLGYLLPSPFRVITRILVPEILFLPLPSPSLEGFSWNKNQKVMCSRVPWLARSHFIFSVEIPALFEKRWKALALLKSPLKNTPQKMFVCVLPNVSCYLYAAAYFSLRFKTFL